MFLQTITIIIFIVVMNYSMAAPSNLEQMLVMSINHNYIQSISRQGVIFDSLFDFWLCGGGYVSLLILRVHSGLIRSTLPPVTSMIQWYMMTQHRFEMVPIVGKVKKKVPSDSSLNQGDLVVEQLTFKSARSADYDHSECVSYSLWCWWITFILLPFIWVHCLRQSS